MRASRRSSRRLAALALLAALAACSSDREKDQYVERPVDQIYNAGMDALLDRNFLDAAKQFDEVERQHPYSVWATKAQLMAAYSYYEADKYDDAIIALDRFIQLHPSNPDTPYAFYLKALCYYEQIADVGRDQRNTRLALSSLDELIRRYPNSAYARDARLKIDLTRDHLAGKEMSIGRFYLRQGEMLAAINRFRTVVDQYQTTSHVPEALHRLVESYTTLGMKSEATQVAAVLGYNYPGSEWYVDSYAIAQGDEPPRADTGGFFSRMVTPAVTLGANVDTSAENARERAAEKAKHEAQLAAEIEQERKNRDKAQGERDAALAVSTERETAARAALQREMTERQSAEQARSDADAARQAAETAPESERDAAQALARAKAAELESAAQRASEASTASATAEQERSAAAATLAESGRAVEASQERLAKLEEQAKIAKTERERAERSAAYWEAQVRNNAQGPGAEQAKANSEQAAEAVAYWQNAERKALAERAAVTGAAAAPVPPAADQPASGQSTSNTASANQAEPPPPAQTPGDARAVDRAPAGTAELGASSGASASPTQQLASTPPAASPEGGPATGRDAYQNALDHALAEQRRARESLAYWNAAANSSDPVVVSQARQNSAAAQQALDYWTGREQELRKWRGGKSASDEGKSEGDGWLGRTWKSIF